MTCRDGWAGLPGTEIGGARVLVDGARAGGPRREEAIEGGARREDMFEGRRGGGIRSDVGGRFESGFTFCGLRVGGGMRVLFFGPEDDGFRGLDEEVVIAGGWRVGGTGIV